jgi:V/A-type H+-transporting ATPase subunit C
MKSLARYAATNALVRTMLSELLVGRDFEAIIHSTSLTGAWLALRKTSYGAWVPEDAPVEILAIEKILRETTAQRFKRSTRLLGNAPGDVGRLLLSRWDLDNLEFALRLWHGKDRELGKYLTYPSLADEIPVYDILEAHTLEEAALLLRTTPYVEPITAALPAYRESKSIFYVELSLEKDFYRRLLRAASDLGGEDAKRAERIIGAEVDLLNLAWLSRLADYYGVQPGDLHAYVIAGPSVISRRLAEPGLSVEKLKSIKAEVLGDRAAEKTEAGAERGWTSMLEVLVGEMAVETARSILSGYPFSIGCIFAFYLLKRTELTNLNTVFAGKSLGADESEISGRLYGLR